MSFSNLTDEPEEIQCDNLDEFIKLTGMITEARELKELEAPLGYDDGGSYDACRESLHALLEFCERKPEFHVITFIDGEYGDTFVNRAAIANRITYCLGSGSTNELINVLMEE